jgi:adenosylcobinamide-phosphate synthase
VESILICYLLAARNLRDESMKICRAVENGDTEGARKAVSMIVGRDTAVLDRDGIIRAAVETVAENTSDGVTAPLFYIAFFGAVGGFFYKAANTMDSMIGYKNEKYAELGRSAARLDDVLNFIPSRLSALLMIAVCWLLRFDAKNAFRIWRRDRRKHASPNSAQTESACAGALHLRLAGDAWYFGELHKKPYIGDDDRAIEPADIRRSNWLMYGTSVLMLLLSAAVRCIIFGVFCL